MRVSSGESGMLNLVEHFTVNGRIAQKNWPLAAFQAKEIEKKTRFFETLQNKTEIKPYCFRASKVTWLLI